jgi:uncharacterized low-complexity protein
MSAMDVHAEIPSAQNFHPEFGYLCPSAHMRRRVRRAALTVLAGMMIAAGSALALVPQLVPQPPAEGAREQSALSVPASPSIEQAADAGRAQEGKANEGKPAAMAASATVTDRSPVTERRPASARAQTPCDDLSGSFLAPPCKFGKAGKSRMTRSGRGGSRQVAIIPIGRTEAAPQVEQQPGEQPRGAASRPAPAAETAPSAVATNADPTVPPLEKPAASAKKPVKTVRKQAPSRDITSADAIALARSPGFGAFGLFHEPSHTGYGNARSGTWAMSW